MSHSNRIVINSASRRAASAVIIPDGAPPSVWGDSSSARPLGALLAASLLGSLSHELFGVGTAMVVVTMVLPTLAALLVWAYSCRAGNPDAALQHVAVAALVTPILALPSALLGLTATVVCGAGIAASRWTYHQLCALQATPRLEVIELSL